MKNIIIAPYKNARKPKCSIDISAARYLIPIIVGLYSGTVFAQCNAITNHQEVDLSLLNKTYASKMMSMSMPVAIAQAQRAVKSLSGTQQSEKRMVASDMAPLVKSQLISPRVSIESELEELYTENEKYKFINQNRFLDVQQSPVSTFSVDVDTASYANVRRFINQGQLPPPDAVRTEEIVNYFDYSYLKPENVNTPVNINYELTETPWNAKTKLLKIALQAKEIAVNSGSNIVFLIDVSGSMSSADKLPLLKKSLTMFTKQLTAQDCVSIVTYAGNANMVLNATAGNQQSKIDRVIKQLRAGGSTNGGDGLALAYELAAINYRKDGVNRVLLATDGDFNLGMSDPTTMESYISKQRKTGVDLSILGFGQGNYNDHLMEALSNAGNGNAAYIDSLQEASKVLVNQMRSNFVTVAYDTKVQLEFNPSVVSSYRLLGYENRSLTKREFVDDKKDAGDMGSGQSVTAIYELFYEGDDETNKLRYQSSTKKINEKQSELGFIKLRYKSQFDAPSKQVETPVLLESMNEFEQTSDGFRLAIAAAAYAEKLRNSTHLLNYSWESVIKLASSVKAADEFGYRHQFIQLLRLVKTLSQ
jgi:Ca-activated chloride channel family protein